MAKAKKKTKVKPEVRLLREMRKELEEMNRYNRGYHITDELGNHITYLRYFDCPLQIGEIINIRLGNPEWLYYPQNVTKTYSFWRHYIESGKCEEMMPFEISSIKKSIYGDTLVTELTIAPPMTRKVLIEKTK